MYPAGISSVPISSNRVFMVTSVEGFRVQGSGFRG